MEDSSPASASADDSSEDIVSRETLYEQAWSTPMTKIAVLYGVSSSYLARVFTDLDVPRPPVGYWAQVAVGKGKARPLLPPAKPGNRDAWSRNGAPIRVALPSQKKPVQQMGKSRRPRPVLPSRHPALLDVEAHFKKANEGEDGYLKPSKRAMADLIVSRNGAAYIIDVANQLYLALLSKGLTVTVGSPGAHMTRNEVDHREQPSNRYVHPRLWQPDRATLVHIGAIAFGLTLYEVSENVPVKHVDKHYVRLPSVAYAKRHSPFRDGWVMSADMPTGRLCLQIYSPYYGVDWIQRWVEDKPGDLVKKIPSILKILIAEAPALAQKVETERELSELQRQRWELEWQENRRRDEERRKLKAIQDSRDQLQAVIQNWAEVNSIRAFFDDIENSLGTLAPEQKQVILGRLSRAKDLIGELRAMRHFERWEPPPT